MAGAPPSRTPVLNLGGGNGQSNDATSFATLLQLPPELRVMVYEEHFKDFGTVPSTHYQPDLALTSRLLRQEALPLFYQRSTFATTMNIWTRHNNRLLAPSLDVSTDDMLDNVPEENLSLVTKVKLLLEFNITPTRRFEVTFDFKQWHDFSLAARIERVVPKGDIKYEDLFMGGIRAAMKTVFKDVSPLEGNRWVTCEQVLSVAEKEIDDVFYLKNELLECAEFETLDAFGLA